MKIQIDKNIVEFLPENEQETASMETLWRVVVDCAADNKRMTAIGEYIPSKQNLARFHIEGVSATTAYTDDHAVEECTVICTICNKYMKLKGGDAVPLCCGREMEVVD
ncbi:MAG: hypothetical protein U9R57_16535 [Thermodesulfobacteriota bacterium]|nr:hypothetical protein [Thermodesulfobacteriota bacterium]